MRSASFACRIAIGVSTFACATSPAQDARSLVFDLGEDQVIELVYLRGGTFEQGSPPGEPQRGADETQRTVTLTRAFFLGKYPVTCGQFARFVAEKDYHTEGERGTLGGIGWDGAQFVRSKSYTWKMPGFAQTAEDPVTLVTHNDARAFLAWLSEKSGRTFTLPTEAQWEYACRAGSTTAHAHGDDPAKLADFAWYDRNSPGGTRGVGFKQLNPWGLDDMPGNAWEWCEDWYAPYQPGPVTDPLRSEPNLPEPPRRVLRGGSWARDATACRSARRHHNDPSNRNAENGFRVMTFDPAPPPNPAMASTPRVVARAPATTSGANAATTPNPPGATQAPTSATPPRDISRISLALYVTGTLAVAIAVVQLLRRFTFGRRRVAPPTSAAVRGSSSRLRIRLADDGFWIESSELPEGTLLDCRYAADGQAHHEKVAFRAGPRGQFIFTAGHPSGVSVTVHPGSAPPPRPPRG